MIAPPPLPAPILDPIVRLALAEDLGRAGDLTSDATLLPGTRIKAEIRARKTGVLAGMDAAAHTLKCLDEGVALDQRLRDSDKLAPGDVIATLTGEARSILMAERTMLNFIGRLSGVATLTAAFVEKIRHTDATIVCTRKTTPGHRALEKRAVRCGGGTSHRYGLDDAILIKDNHIAACGSVGEALKRAHAYAGHLRMIEVEVDTLAQLEEALPHKPHAVLLDNMDTDALKAAVAMIDGACKAEASGGVNFDTVAGIAETGVDYISVGALTHSASNLDVGLDLP
ncbi:carboxylating nicotinate-nucleotide diphosphorylase [Henriciella aquimarina]|uniref:carboxylating nicotinate-nucleotide diphosphorylase n=1 Tax=Henriciella aquimarina TaxID=545261 RepID=UPI000A02D14F|nr:carboxylating nicotinate-nucleotide diphosphorylase [Henriciella aquimarina]